MNAEVWRYRERLSEINTLDFGDHLQGVILELRDSNNERCQTLAEIISELYTEIWSLVACQNCGTEGKIMEDCPECGGDGGFGDFICPTCEGECQIYELCENCGGDGFDMESFDHELLKQAVLTIDLWFL